MVVRTDREEQIFDPAQIRSALEQFGFNVPQVRQAAVEREEPDDELWLVERVMRTFLRANQINEAVIRTKLGVRAAEFFDVVLPELLRVKLLEVIPYIGHGNQRRFRMRIQMQTFHDALSECGGSFARFLSLIERP